MVRFDSSEIGPSQWADGVAKVMRDLDAYERDQLPLLPEEYRAKRQEQIDEARRRASVTAETLAGWIAADALRDF
jgi:hypothetical protein